MTPHMPKEVEVLWDSVNRALTKADRGATATLTPTAARRCRARYRHPPETFVELTVRFQDGYRVELLEMPSR